MSPVCTNNHRPAMLSRTVLAATLLVGCVSGTASATMLDARSDAHGVEVNLSAVSGLFGLSVGPAAVAAGIAPGAYHQSATLATLSGDTIGVASLNTALLSSIADSNVDGTPGSRATSAMAEVNGLNLRVVPGLVLTPDLLHLSATTIRSTAQVTGDVGALAAAGGFFIEGLTLTIAGIGNVVVDANAAPNTVVIDALGIRIVANEQILGGDGLTSRSLTANALHISISGLSNVVNGDIVVAHSYAQMSIPAPASASCAALALCVLGSRRRRR